MASRSYDRVDFYRRNRDYSRLLGGCNLEEKEEKEEKEEAEEADFDSRPSRRSAADEDAKTTRERQEYVQRRQKLKELERLKLKEKFTGVYGSKTVSLKNENGNQNSRHGENINDNNKRKRLSNDNYGSFFGPTQPVIARRVIEETRAKLETAHFSAKVSKEVPEHKKSSTAAVKSSSAAVKSSSAATKSSTTVANTKAVLKKKPVVTNEAMKKAQQLKAARDYSFLFSDDAEIPAPERQQASESRNVASSRPKNGQPKQVVVKNSMEMKKPPLSKSISHATEFKSMGSSSRQMPTKVDPQKSLVDSKKQLRKVVSGGHLANENGSKYHSVSNAKMDVRGCSDKKRPPLNPGPKDIKAEHQQSFVKAKHQQSSTCPPTSVQKILPSKTPIRRPQAEQRKPVASHKSMPSNSLAKPVPKLVPKLAPKPVPKLAPKPVPKPAPKPAPKLAPKPSPKHVPKLAPKSQARPLSRDLHHDRPKKRSRDYVSDEDMDEGTNFRSLIRQMFRYDPNKYRDNDEDDSDMEVGFSRIQAEERRSARIAREEDERELALIEAEEREERARAKKRKLKQSQR